MILYLEFLLCRFYGLPHEDVAVRIEIWKNFALIKLLEGFFEVYLLVFNEIWSVFEH